LREAFHHAVRWQLAARNPTDAVAPPLPAITEMRVLDADQVAELLTAAAETPYYAFIYVAVATGARLGELLALRWEDIDLGTGTMFITRTVKRIPGRGLTFSTPKTHRSRRPVALSAETRNVFQEHRRRQLEHRLKMGPAYQDQGLVFASPTGQLMDDSNLRRAFARIVSAARLEHLRIHDLRHTAATLMLRAGVHPKVVSERLGHATVSITLDTYSHVLPDMQRDAAEALDRLMGPSSIWVSKEQ
jgi:integrase